MSAVRSLSGGNRTWPERPESVEIDPTETLHHRQPSVSGYLI